MTATNGHAGHRHHADFEHLAVFHDGPADLADRLAPTMTAALDRSEPVLVCLPTVEWSHIADQLGPAADDVTCVPPDVRYERPGVAMAMVERFAADAVASGAPVAWSIGSLPLRGTDEDRRWHRYEAAVNDVLGALPLHAWCAYDTRTTSPDMLAAARDTHPADGRCIAPDLGPAPHPAAPPLLAIAPDDAATARHALEGVFRDALPADRLDDLRLVATELVTNGLRHGAPPVEVRAWVGDHEAVVEVSDAGSGLAARYPDLRPNRGGPTGGYGYWLVGQLGDRVDVERVAGRTRVTVGFDLVG